MKPRNYIFLNHAAQIWGWFMHCRLFIILFCFWTRFCTTLSGSGYHSMIPFVRKRIVCWRIEYVGGQSLENGDGRIHRIFFVHLHCLTEQVGFVCFAWFPSYWWVFVLDNLQETSPPTSHWKYAWKLEREFHQWDVHGGLVWYDNAVCYMPTFYALIFMMFMCSRVGGNLN